MLKVLWNLDELCYGGGGFGDSVGKAGSLDGRLQLKPGSRHLNVNVHATHTCHDQVVRMVICLGKEDMSRVLLVPSKSVIKVTSSSCSCA